MFRDPSPVATWATSNDHRQHRRRRLGDGSRNPGQSLLEIVDGDVLKHETNVPGGCDI
jgi:hypothetical protein